MHVPHHPALRVGQVRHRRVVRPGARHRSERIGVVAGQDQPPQPEQADVPPIAGVELLAVEQQHAAGRRRVDSRQEGADVRDPLLLVDDQVVDEIEPFGARLLRQICGRVAVTAAVVHVDVEVAAPPLSRKRQPRQRHRHRGLRVDLAPHHRVSRPARDLDLEGPGRNRHPPLARAVHISGLHALALGDEEIVGVDPGVVRSEEAAARVRHRQARRERTARLVLHLHRQRPPRRQEAPLARHHLPLLARHRVHDPQAGRAGPIGDEGDLPAVPRPARVRVVELAVGERDRVPARQGQEPELVPLPTEI